MKYEQQIPPHTSWGAIIAGTILAFALHFILSLLGVGLGFLSIDLDSGLNLEAYSWATGIWIAISTILALFAGGYVASRLSYNTENYAGTINSLIVWAVVISLNFITVGIGIVGLTASVGQLVSGVRIPPQLQKIANLEITEVQNKLENILEKTDNKKLKIIIEKEYINIKSAAKQASNDILLNPGEIPSILKEFGQTVENNIQEINKKINTEDLASIIESNSNLSSEKANIAAQRWVDTIEQWAQSFKLNFEESTRAIISNIEDGSESIGKFSLTTFFILILGLIAAIAGGRLGGSKT